MLLRTGKVYQYIVIMDRAVFNCWTDLWPSSMAKLCGRAMALAGERHLRKGRERIISPVEQRVVQQGTLQIGELLRRR